VVTGKLRGTGKSGLQAALARRGFLGNGFRNKMKCERWVGFGFENG